MPFHAVTVGPDRQRSLSILADRLESGMYELMISVASAVGEFRTTVDRVSGLAIGEASGGLHGVAEVGRELDGAVTGLVRKLADAADLARRSAEIPGGCAAAIDLSRPLARAREIGRLVLDVAGNANLMALNATVDATAVHLPANDDSDATGRIGALAGRSVHAAEEIAWRLAEIEFAVQDAVAALRGLPGNEARAA